MTCNTYIYTLNRWPVAIDTLNTYGIQRFTCTDWPLRVLTGSQSGTDHTLQRPLLHVYLKQLINHRDMNF